MGDQAEIRRREATRAFIRYFLLTFFLVSALSALGAYAVLGAQAQQRETLRVRIEYCTELEKLKTQNREDVAADKRNYARNLRLLGLADSPDLRKAVEQGWALKLKRNAPKPCPYTG